MEKRRQRGEAFGLIISLSDLGALQRIQGYYEEALGYYHEGLELATKQGMKTAELAFSINLAEVHHDQGSYHAARTSQVQAEALAREMDEADQLALCLTDTGHMRREIGDLAGAEEALTEARVLSRELGVPALEAKVLIGQGVLLAAQGKQTAAREVLEDAVSAGEASKEHRVLLLARLARGEVKGSTEELTEVLEEAERTGLRPLAARSRLALAEAREHRGDDAGETLSLLAEVVQAAGPMHLRDVGFRAHGLAADLLQARGEEEAAVEHVVAAVRLLEEMRQGLAGDVLESFLTSREPLVQD